MLGEDTLVLTRGGFKKVKDLNLYDEVLTSYGNYEPIVEMGPWKKVDKVVQFSTGERIMCSDDVLWDTYIVGSSSQKYVYTDEIEVDKHACSNILDIVDCGKYPVHPSYDYAVVVPTCVPNAYIQSSKGIRLGFFAGLVDSPICEVGDSDGRYDFYTTYSDLAEGIVTLARSLGWTVRVKVDKGVICICVGVTQYAEELPIKFRKNGEIRNMPVRTGIRFTSVEDIPDNNEVFGRKIKVNGGNIVIGYSLIPVN